MIGFKLLLYSNMKIKWLSLTIGLAFGYCACCHGAYVVFRTGFGQLKSEGLSIPDKKQTTLNATTSLYQDPRVCNKNINYTNHHNLSVAFGGRFDILDIGAVGVELEILGAYAITKQYPYNKLGFDNTVNIPYKGCFVMRRKRNLVDAAGNDIDSYFRKLFCLKNQRIAGAMINIYWEQYLFDGLSVGIGGGIGGAYVCTKFTTIESKYTMGGLRVFGAGGAGVVVGVGGAAMRRLGRFGLRNVAGNVNLSTGKKYVHTGSLLYNFNLFVRAEMFETLFEVGYRHIGLHQMFGGKCYGFEIHKLGNMYSDQVYLGLGRTF